MKKIMLMVTLVCLLMGIFTVSAWAQPGNRLGPGGLRSEYTARLGHKLGLTLEQRQKMLAIRQDFEKDTLDLRIDMRNKRQELRNLWTVDPLDQKAIDGKTRELNGIRIQMINKGRLFRSKLKAILTPIQLKKLKKLNDIEQERSDRMKGPGRRGYCGNRNWE
jgi:Spy/CpxP family protein refolding chaperone